MVEKAWYPETCTFCRVEGLVGHRQDGFRLVCMGWRAGNPDADANIRLAELVKVVSAAHSHCNPLRGGNRLSGRSVQQKRGKFVAAESSSRVALAKIDQEPSADFLQQQIAGSVAKTVVNVLEAVQVEAKKSAWISFARGSQSFI